MRTLKENPELEKVELIINGVRVEVSEELALLLLKGPVDIKIKHPIPSASTRRILRNPQFKSITLEEHSRLLKRKRLPADLATPLGHSAEQPDSTPSGEDLTVLTAFGMWADREDMENPTEWVRNLRLGRYRDF